MIVKVELDNKQHALIHSNTGSIEHVRSILILELLKNDWDNADKSYSALKTLLSKERRIEIEDIIRVKK